MSGQYHFGVTQIACWFATDTDYEVIIQKPVARNVNLHINWTNHNTVVGARILSTNANVEWSGLINAPVFVGGTAQGSRAHLTHLQK